MKKIVLALVIFVSNAAYSEAACAQEVWQEDIEEIIAGYISDKSIPGLTVAVIRDGNTQFMKAYGLSNVEMNISATPATVYPISSVSKIFAGLVAMALAEEGRLDLDASVLTYLDGLPEAYRPITIRHLLSHTHGLTDFYHSDAFDNLPEHAKHAMSAEDIIGWNAPRPYKFQPGEGWDYGLLGYVILNEIFEQVGKAPYPDLVAKYITGPLQLTSAKFGGTEVVVKGRHPVLYELAEGRLINHSIDFPAWGYTAGGLNISVEDLAKLFIAIDEGKILTAESLQEIWTPVENAATENPFYGLGWTAVRRKNGRFLVGHEGGGNAWAYYWPEDHIAVIALSNMSGSRADRLPLDIVDRILRPTPPTQ